MDEAALARAGNRCFEILTSVLEEHDDVYVSLACTGRLLAHGAHSVVKEVAEAVLKYEKMKPEEAMQFIDLLPVNSFVALANKDPKVVFATVERQMSISALITAHAFFESVMKDLLRITIVCDREKWLSTVGSKTVSLEMIRERGIDASADELFEKELKSLTLAGMPALVGRLLGFCKGNVTTVSHFHNYRLDTEKLRDLDQRRHKYAHRRTKEPYSIREAEKDLRYLTITSVHLITCIMESFGLKMRSRPTVSKDRGQDHDSAAAGDSGAVES